MAVLKIRQFGDPVLREKARPVDRVTGTHRRLIEDMIETMRAAPGVGLAATQVGVLERIFVWEAEDRCGALVNPRLLRLGPAREEVDEGCLSLPGLLYPVERSTEVVIEGTDENGNPVRLEVDDYVARIFQHELDHLDGVLFIDHLPEDLRRKALSQLREQLLSAGE